MAKYDPQKHHRRSIRVNQYDYTQPGGYFITLVTLNRYCLFGNIMDGLMRLSDLGQIAFECWRAIPEHFPNVELGASVVMPNHVHGIIWQRNYYELVIRNDEELNRIHRYIESNPHNWTVDVKNPGKRR
jgi:REP element-mobilizing transposase RayT